MKKMTKTLEEKKDFARRFMAAYKLNEVNDNLAFELHKGIKEILLKNGIK